MKYICNFLFTNAKHSKLNFWDLHQFASVEILPLNGILLFELNTSFHIACLDHIVGKD
jgi:hypothetical protein